MIFNDYMMLLPSASKFKGHHPSNETFLCLHTNERRTSARAQCLAKCCRAHYRKSHPMSIWCTTLPQVVSEVAEVSEVSEVSVVSEVSEVSQVSKVSKVSEVSAQLRYCG